MKDTKILWASISDFIIGGNFLNYTFSDKLAKENGWTLEYTLRVIQEYKKFMFLICTTNQVCCPSEPVDQAWHLHLLYTENYWEDFCDRTLEQRINHGPSRGGRNETLKYVDMYNNTLRIYEEAFGYAAPEDIWHSAEVRFKKNNTVRVDKDDYWVVPKLNFLIRKIWKFLKG